MTRIEWWRDEVHVRFDELADAEEIVRDAVKRTLAKQGGVGEPDVRVWRVRCSPLPGCIRLVVLGSSKRRVGQYRAQY